MANSTVGNLPVQATPLIGADILPISRDGTNLNRTTLTNLKTFTDNNSFSTVVVAGQNSVVADSASDTLTLVAGTNVTLTTNDINDSITISATGGGGGGSASIPTYTADVATGRNIITTDLQNLIIYNSASNANFQIQLDSALGLTGFTNASFEIYQKASGTPTITAAAGVTLVIWSGYPTSALGVTQTAHRVGANTWAVK